MDQSLGSRNQAMSVQASRQVNYPLSLSLLICEIGIIIVPLLWDSFPICEMRLVMHIKCLELCLVDSEPLINPSYCSPKS